MKHQDLDDALREFSEGGDFERDWAQALAAPRRSWAAPTLAAAAVLCWVTWSVWPAAPSTASGGLGPASPEVEEADSLIRMRVGQNEVFDLGGELHTVSILLPKLLTVDATERATHFRLRAHKEGRTDVIAVSVDGSTRIWTVEIAGRALPREEHHTMVMGQYLLLDWPDLESAAIDDPKIIELRSVGPGGTLTAGALTSGYTEVVVRRNDGSTSIVSFEVKEQGPVPRDPNPPPHAAPSSPDDTQRMILDVMRDRRQSLLDCYDVRRPLRPELQGRWRVSFTVRRDGATEDVSAEGLELADAQLEACLVRVVLDWEFSPIDNPQPVSKSYRFK